MSSTGKIAIGLGLASGVLIAAWLLTGNRKQKTKQFIVKKTTDIRQSLKPVKVKKNVYDDSGVYYI
jgi:hypothetical protein